MPTASLPFSSWSSCWSAPQAGLGTLYADTHRERGEALVQGFENATATLVRLLETRARISDR